MSVFLIVSVFLNVLLVDCTQALRYLANCIFGVEGNRADVVVSDFASVCSFSVYSARLFNVYLKTRASQYGYSIAFRRILCV